MIRTYPLLAAIGALALFSVPGLAQAPLVTWSARLEPADVRAGEQAQVVVTATLKAGWHIYALAWPGVDVYPTQIEVKPGSGLKPTGEAVQPPPSAIKDPITGKDVRVFSNTVAFGVPVRVEQEGGRSRRATVSIGFQTCDDRVCNLPENVEVAFEYSVADGAPRPDRLTPVTAVPPQPAAPAEVEKPSPPSPAASAQASSGGQPPVTGAPRRGGLLAFLVAALLAGVASLLTPCVFPMIPLTVSFFSKQKVETGRAALVAPLAYCGGIIGTFTLIGVLVSAVFGATNLQNLAANPILNLGLAALFVVLAANLFGVFEIVLPGWLVNRAQGGTGRGGIVGPMIMGLVFTLTSFTCTVPFAGTLLAAASQGEFFYPALGMLVYSTAFATPFFFLARFPGYLSRMPKSGNWLTAVKATMGFLELLAAAKFLSNADIAWDLGLFTRPIFLAVWAAILFVAAIYLLGWMRLPHDPQKLPIGWPRRTVGIVMAVFGFYCLAALEGAPLKQLEAFPPPEEYGRFRAERAGAISWLHDYEEGAQLAARENRLLFVNFTGATCVNCREMEKNVLPRPAVLRELRKMVPVELYTDRQKESDRKNQALQVRLIQSTALPVYAVLRPDGTLVRAHMGRASEEEFVRFLREAQEMARLARRD